LTGLEEGLNFVAVWRISIGELTAVDKGSSPWTASLAGGGGGGQVSS